MHICRAKYVRPTYVYRDDLCWHVRIKIHRFPTATLRASPRYWIIPDSLLWILRIFLRILLRIFPRISPLAYAQISARHGNTEHNLLDQRFPSPPRTLNNLPLICRCVDKLHTFNIRRLSMLNFKFKSQIFCVGEERPLGHGED